MSAAAEAAAAAAAACFDTGLANLRRRCLVDRETGGWNGGDEVLACEERPDVGSAAEAYCAICKRSNDEKYFRLQQRHG